MEVNSNLETSNSSKHAKRMATILRKMREAAAIDKNGKVTGRVIFQNKWEIADIIGIKSSDKKGRKTFGRDFNDLVLLGLISEVKNREGSCPYCGTKFKTESGKNNYYCLPDLRPEEADFS